ncbi:MAG: DNA mismatch repair protein MutS [Alphaproteobacteria bacterium]|nr:MAG: DNA mismatch repair protein MutS [Alphaproteobacteria bacterium]
MTRKGRGLSDDERALWDTVTRAVAPLRRRKAAKAKETVEGEEVVVPSPAKPGRRAEAAAPMKPAQRPGPPPLAPLGRRMRQKLGRGTEPIDARIDLHGMTQADAHAALAQFLRRAQHSGARVVLVITGKGARPGADGYSERGVLRRQVPLWLESAELRSFVVGFESAGAGHGREGALYVRVRRGR